MSSSSSASSWIRDVLEYWDSGKIKKCCKILSKKSNLHFCLSAEEIEPGDETFFYIGSSESDRLSRFKYHFVFPSSENDVTIACNNHSGCCLLTELIRVNDYAILHNLLIVFNVLFGIVLDIESLQEKVEQDLIKEGLNQPDDNLAKSEPNASKQSLLAPSAYANGSIERQLAILGRHLPIAWYNLVLYHFLNGSYRLSLQASEELIDHLLLKPDAFSSAGLPISFLYVTLVIKLKTYSSKLELVVSAIAASLSEQQADSRAYIRWFHLIKVHIFSVQNRLQDCRNELAAIAQSITSSNDHFEGDLHSAESSLVPEKKFLSTAASHIASFNDCFALFLKSRLLVLEQDFSRAESELSKVIVNPSNAIAYYNNLGVIAFHQRRYAAASIYFHKAFQETQKVCTQTTSKLRAKLLINQNFIGIVIYNLGLQMHMLQKYEEAYKLFKQSLKFEFFSSHIRGMSLLRLSEAIVQIYLAKQRPVTQVHSIPEICRTSGCIRVFTSTPRSSETDKLLHSSAYYLITAFMLFQRLCLVREKKMTAQPDNLSNVDLLNNESLDDFTPSIERLRFVCIYCQILLSWIFLETESFEKARQCALQALELKKLYFPTQHLEDKKNQIIITGKIVSQLTTGISNGEHFKSRSSSSYLCDSSQIDSLSFSAYAYLAESELRLGNLNSALDILHSIPKRTDMQISIGYDVQRISCSQKISLYCNLACVYIAKGDETQARRFIDKSISLAPDFLAAIALKVYLDIKNGQIDSAIQLLCNYRVHQLIHVRTDK